MGPKIWAHPANPDVIFGFTGDATVGANLRDWISNQSLSAWERFLTDAGEELARLNGEMIRRAKLAEMKPSEPASALIGGFLGPERSAKLVEIASSGGVYPYERFKPAVMAGDMARVAALAEWNAIEKASPDLDPASALVAMMEGTIQAIPSLGGDVQRLFAQKVR
jgi:hypothetical protein